MSVVTSEPGLMSRTTNRSSAAAWQHLVLLGVGAAYKPLSVMAQNTQTIGHPERLLALTVVIWLLAVATYLMLRRLGVQSSPSAYTVFIATVMLMSGRPVRVMMPNLGLLIVAAVIVLVFVVFVRLQDHVVPQALVIGLAVMLMADLGVSLFRSLNNLGTDSVHPTGPLQITLAETPDIFVVVVDGYVGLKMLEQDSGLSKDSFRDALNSRGFQVPTSTWTSYWETVRAVPSMLDMSYPTVDEERTVSTKRHLISMIGGANALNHVLGANGYQTTMIESGWSGSSCGDQVYRCIPSSWFDEAMSLALKDSLVVDAIRGQVGSAYSWGAVRAMEWLSQNTQQLSLSPEPEFVFAHLIAPHPPFHLDADCDVRADDALGGWSFYHGGADDSFRDAAFLDQVECVDSFMVEMADLIGDDDIVVFVGDHGTDRRGQLNGSQSWTEDEMRERMSTFMAVRAPGCEIGDPVILPNLMRRLISCLGDSHLPDLAPRMFTFPMTEADSKVVLDLIAG